MPVPRPPSRRLSDWLPYAIVAVLVVMLLMALAGVSIWQERVRQRERAAAATQNLARLLEGRVTDVFTKIDLMLQVAAYHAVDHLLDDASSPFDAERELQAYRAAAPEIVGMTVVDAMGQLRYGQGQVGRSAAQHFAQREDFVRARQGGEPGLLIAGPVRHDETGTWVMMLSRALQGRQGEFLGIVSADLPVDLFGPVFRDVDLGAHGAATLRTAGLALVYRQPWPDSGRSGIGRSEVSQQLREAIAARPDAGEYVAATALDGVSRINAYRKLRGLPLYLVVGLPEADFPSGWNRVDTSIVLLAVSTLAVAGFALLQLRRVSRRQLDAAQRRFEAIVESSQDAIVSKTLDGKVTSWNRGAEQIFGYSAAEMLGQPLQRLFPPERRDEEEAIIERLRGGEPVEHFETERLHKSGRRVPVSVTISPLVDQAGELIGASKIARDISRQKAMEEEVRSLAFHDPLTRLPNRRLLLDRLRHAQQNSRRLNSHGAVLFIDLDQFKELNDRHGHDAGDRLLVEVARRLRSAVRESDTVARLGGDEFVVICENLGQELAVASEAADGVREKIAQALAQPWLLSMGMASCVGASIGVRLFFGGDDDLDQLIQDADRAMYDDKARRRAGRGEAHA
ncbi:diguanylate cyclase [Ideonella azotifigens]|uniref:Diguanylate cyclase n=2 Tax=Ideonella azotifigens TaxID=513160 RepID=A0ABN1KGW7_9BURK|nr:diguanylate cyclase [Ideonella azotifigens]MCD2340437.1 diguanylate cyclase [Ideonella azotifigens]